jgi:three-Cys-motif partner protein
MTRRSYFVEGGLQADPCGGLPIERGPKNTGVGIWVPTEKHRLLAEYLYATRHAWANKTWKHRIFIDPFCGPGRLKVEGEPGTRDGGAVVAWREMLAANVPFTHMFVGDKDHARADACAARLRALGAPATPLHGEASLTVPEMVARVPRDALCFAYIDPYNLQLLTFDLFKALAPLRVDMAVHFSTMDLTRNVEMEFDPNRDRFDGTAPGWATDPLIRGCSKANVKLEFFNYWLRSVSDLGFTSSKEMPLVRNNSQRPIYRLVFLAKHDMPLRVWNDIARDSAQLQLL